jgi:protein TonB
MVSSIESSDRARRAAPWIRRGGGAVLMSAAVHAAAAMTIGGVLVFAPAAPGATSEPAPIDVTVMSLADRPLPQSAPTPSPAATAPAHAPVGTHRRLVAPRAPAAPQQPAVVPPSTPSPAPPADEPRPMFALSAGTVASGPALSVPAAAPPGLSQGLTTRSSTSRGEAASSDVGAVGEHEVDVPARLLAAAPLAYPPAARQSEIELDFPLEIVVDVSGRVVSARALTQAGFGLDEAALQGIRGYRFSPAVRSGRPVAVRMRWVVQFRLR